MLTAPILDIFSTSGKIFIAGDIRRSDAGCKTQIVSFSLIENDAQKGSRRFRLLIEITFKGALGKGAVEELGTIASQNANGNLVIVILGGLHPVDDR